MPADARSEATSAPLGWALGALAWGFAEATLFFIVPDVLISFAGLRSFKRATVTTLCALAGALAGGAVMWWFGAHRPGTLAVLGHIPGISAAMVAGVGARTREAGLWAVIGGPLRGVPYKIYAAQWGANGGALFPFLLASVVARVPRFLGSGYVAQLIARAASRRLGPGAPRRLDIATAGFWVLFYIVYFAVIAPGAMR